jgi:putative flippase GtrA
VQVVRFLLVGLLNTGVGFAVILGAMALGVDYRWANALGYGVGCLVGFVGNRSWTFRHDGPWHISLARWLLVVAVAYAANLALVVALHEGLQVEATLAQIGGIVVYTSVAFLGGRLVAFRGSERRHEGRGDNHG